MSITLYKAQDIGNVKVESGILCFANVIPHYLDADMASKCYREQAEYIARFLLDTLPGGTLDNLIAALLVMKASKLRIPYGG